MAPAVSNDAGRHSFSQILAEFFKFAVDSAIDGSLKIIPGRKHEGKMVREGLIDIPMSTPLKTKKHLDKKFANELLFETKVEEVKEETQLKTKKHLDKKVANELLFETKVEEEKEEMNNIKQQYKTSIKLVEDSQPPNKMGDNGFKGINLMQKDEKRVFIQSRL